MNKSNAWVLALVMFTYMAVVAIISIATVMTGIGECLFTLVPISVLYAYVTREITSS